MIAGAPGRYIEDDASKVAVRVLGTRWLRWTSIVYDAGRYEFLLVR